VRQRMAVSAACSSVWCWLAGCPMLSRVASIILLVRVPCLPIYELARSHRHQNRSGSRTSIRREFRVIQFFIQYLFPLKRPFTNRFKGGVTCKSSMKEIMHERESNNAKQTHAACCEAH
jgi:hypothetical protein